MHYGNTGQSFTASVQKYSSVGANYTRHAKLAKHCSAACKTLQVCENLKKISLNEQQRFRTKASAQVYLKCSARDSQSRALYIAACSEGEVSA